MSQRILKNNTGSPVTINDVGQTVPASGQLVINPTDYGKYEGSSDVIGFIGSAVLTVNDGTFDLSITDGTRLIQGGFYLPISDGADPTIKASVIQDLVTYGKNFLAISGFVAVSGSALPAGASTSANQLIEIGILTAISGHETSIDGKLYDNYGAASGALRTAAQIGNTAGQADFDAGAVGPQTLRTGANQLGVWNINNISGTISLPTGAATSANQTTEIAILTSISGFNSSIDSKLNTLGQKNMAGSVPVTMASNQSLIGVSGSLGRADKSAFTYGTSFEQVIGGVYQDNLPTLVSGTEGVIRLTQYRAMHENLRDSNGNEIASQNNGNANQQLLGTLTPDTTTAAATFDVSGASVQVAMAGLTSAGFQINAGTFIGTVVPEISMDGGVKWFPTVFYDFTLAATAASYTFGSANPDKQLTVVLLGGTSHVRVKVSAYTSGSATAIMRASFGVNISLSPSGAGGGSAAFGTVTVTYLTPSNNTITLLLATNIGRKYALISNPSGSQMSMLLGNGGVGLTASSGIIIPAKSFYEFRGDNLWTGNIYGFMAGGAALTLIEGTA